MFLPISKQEMNKLGWEQCDIVLITGDAYIDSYYDGTAVIGKYLMKFGYKVGVISQPDINNAEDFSRLGAPKLFWGVSAGCVDSMVANYTALKKRRNSCDLTPGGENNRRPDRAVMKYANAIQRFMKNTAPMILGGVEASLRRVAHYDFWDNSIRRSILADAKADALVYGMGESQILAIAQAIQNGEDYHHVRGICYLSKEIPEGYIELPAYDKCKTDKAAFTEMFNVFYKNNDALNAKGLTQLSGDRYLIQNPPAFPHSQSELDAIYEMDFENDVHPLLKKLGAVRALDTTKFSITSHRGCFGECNFCAITVHQGRRINSRSKESILNEAKKMTKDKRFKGIIFDVGGATANMYGMSCKKQSKSGSCQDKRCLSPEVCKGMNINHNQHLEILNDIRNLAGVKKVFIGSGLRFDLIIEDRENGKKYMYNLVEHHVSGQLKIAPEHAVPSVMNAMGKPIGKYLTNFKSEFDKITKKLGKNQFLTYYFIAAHPGCTEGDMAKLKQFINKELKLNPEQVQIFTPTPSTYATLMYVTEKDYLTGKPVFVEKEPHKKKLQKEIITGKPHRK